MIMHTLQCWPPNKSNLQTNINLVFAHLKPSDWRLLETCWKNALPNVLLTTYFEVLLHTFPISFVVLCFEAFSSMLPCGQLRFLSVDTRTQFVFKAWWAHNARGPSPSLYWSARLPNVFLRTLQPFPHINHLYVSVYESNDVLWKKGWIFLMELCHNLVAFRQSQEETKV